MMKNKQTNRRLRDIRLRALLTLTGLVILIALIIHWLPAPTVETVVQGSQPTQDHDFVAFSNLPGDSSKEKEEKVWRATEAWIDPTLNPRAHQHQAKMLEHDKRFQQAVTMLHAKRYEEALTALDRALELMPNNADSYANMGYALLGLEDYSVAYQAFDKAMNINPSQANAYYGAAMAMEEMGNIEGALGGMRSFIHLSQDKSKNQIHVARARSAIWEWESKLGRGPWGPTKGIPPGFTEEELKRNDQGVGIKVTIPGTEDGKGNMQYEIKYSDKTTLFDQ
ncbi:MAG: tetratricopeptide repeat protein [Halopseudomonas sp.]